MTKSRDGAGPAFAAIDIGSNSIKMTVARPGAGGEPEEFAWASETVRLGAGVEETGRLADDRIEAALAVLSRFRDDALTVGATRLVGVATEATRVAANGPAFLDRVRREIGLEVETISGDDEARLTFRGLAATTDVSGRIVVADIGGGSTEVIIAEDGVVRSAQSLRLGSGRLTDRLVPSDPPRPDEIAACRAEASGSLSSLTLHSDDATRLIVLGGTGEYLARLASVDRVLDVLAIEAVMSRLLQTAAAAIADLIGIPEARARVLPAGIAIVLALTELIRPERIEVGRSGIRTGLLLAAFNGELPGHGENA